MKSDFTTAAKVIRQGNSGINVVAINGCCYGIDKKPDKGDYFKYCGQEFWQFISGKSELFIEIIEPLGHESKQKNDAFSKSYDQATNRFIKEFSDLYCSSNGDIRWDALVKFNSATQK